MQDSSQHQPKPNGSAGYRPIVSAEFTRGLGNSAYSYVAAAAGLGLLVGFTVALTAGHAKAPRISPVSAATSVRTSGMSMLPAAYVGSTPSLLRQVEGVKKAPSKPALVSATMDTTKEPRKHKKHGMHKLMDWKMRHGAKRKPYVPENAPVAENQPTALQLATAAAAAGPFVMAIQGDATVADFDAATGTIETYEGAKYVLAKNNNEVSSIQWDNYPFNVHYRCDEAGNCTLWHAGTSASARIAR